MGRTISVSDAELGIEAKITTSPLPEGGTIITRLELTSLEGRGLRPKDLLIFQELGLKLPAPPQPAVKAPAAPQTPAPAAVKAPKVKKPKVPIRKGPNGKTIYTCPPVEDLVALYAELRSASQISDRIGVPRTVIQNWINRLRAEGHPFPRTRIRRDSPPDGSAVPMTTPATAPADMPLFESGVTDA